MEGTQDLLIRDEHGPVVEVVEDDPRYKGLLLSFPHHIVRHLLPTYTVLADQCLLRIAFRVNFIEFGPMSELVMRLLQRTSRQLDGVDDGFN